MREQGVELKLYTLMGGLRRWQDFRVYRLLFIELGKVLWRLPKWVILYPDVMLEAARRLLPRHEDSALNLAETLYGYAFAIVKAHHFRRNKPDLIHCVWATMPASAGWLLSRLVGIPFSMGAHAYDVFKRGGDRLLDLKVREAKLVHTTTESCRKRLLQLGADPAKVVLIRRGLDTFPELLALRSPRPTLRLIAVGRLVPKKGYTELLQILAFCREAGLPFEARIVGGGALADTLQRQRDVLGLHEHVTFTGRVEFEQVKQHLAWADVMLFSGKVAPDGDRDGLPNVIPEAFAWGLPVVTSAVAGTTEAVTDGQTGFVCSLDRPECWLKALQQLQQDDALCQRLRQAGRQWVEEHYDNRRNTHALGKLLKGVIQQESAASATPATAAPLEAQVSESPAG